MSDLKSGTAIREEHMKEAALETMIRLAREHKQSCLSSECGIELSLISWLLHRAGIQMTIEQEREFC